MATVTTRPATTAGTTNAAAERYGALLAKAMEKFTRPHIAHPATVALNAGSTALAAVLFTSLGPVAGALFGAVEAGTYHAINMIVDKCESAIPSLGKMPTFVKRIFSFGAAMAAGYGTLSLLGHTIAPLTLATLASTGLVIFAGTVVTAALVGGLFFCGYAAYEMTREGAGATTARA